MARHSWKWSEAGNGSGSCTKCKTKVKIKSRKALRTGRAIGGKVSRPEYTTKAGAVSDKLPPCVPV